MENNTHFPSSSQGSAPPCRLCGRTCHSHGGYFRKGGHGMEAPIWVPRFCCPRAHFSTSVLPQGLLPICRFPLWLISTIWRLRHQGMSPYSIAKALALSLPCVLRLVSRLSSWTETLVSWCRELDLPQVLPEGLERMGAHLGWGGLCLRFSRAFYPGRFATEGSHTIW